MKNMQEYFNEQYEQDFDRAADLESDVWDWYNNDEQKFNEWIEENNIDLYDIINMANGKQEYLITLWIWDMED